METGAEFDQCTYTATDPNATAVGLDQPVEHLQQSALAGSVPADQPQTFTTVKLKRHIIDRPEFSWPQFTRARHSAGEFTCQIANTVPQRTLEIAAIAFADLVYVY
jgi:hypothetical protein